MPPSEKFYEAWSAIASGRIKFSGDAARGQAEILSSNREKTYHVYWEGNTFYSDDSASYWQGYPGYPVLAALMLLGKLPFCQTCGELLRDVDWHAANARARRDYAQALREVLKKPGIDEAERQKMREEASKAMNALKMLDLVLKRPRKNQGKS